MRLVPISSLIAPATLSVKPIMRNATVMANVPSPRISDGQQFYRFAFCVQDEEAGTEIYLRPRTILTQISVATATSGQILPIRPPFTNSSYQIQFFGPTVKCGDTNTTISHAIDTIKEQKNHTSASSFVEVSSSYFAFVPDLSSPEAIQAADLSNPNGQSNASNKLWMVFPRYIVDEDGVGEFQNHYLTCQLHNASYEVSLSFTEGVQLVEILNLTVLDAIEFPKYSLVLMNNTVQHAYSAFMWALSDQLTGSMGIFHEKFSTGGTNNQTLTFGLINSKITPTNLLGSSDLASYFNQNHALHPENNTGMVSDQRAEDVAKARNRTLDVLIEELSRNITMGLMHSDLLS